ncbi:hypothetical protein LPA44_17150 [Halobacterium sp. KA-4]|uniref:hypothetical protein n=1 Tax=Halobacterium sp. KA-4 TaxID=2896367 RepID=UPI001E3FE12B|nr:hypothetical protein [Halobacterium sp. KA-4]MCD2201592.1 hypothetical protein [Halobacterium sp. KA-4]
MEPEFLLETAEFADVLNDIGEQVSSEFSEDEVQMVFLNEGFFRLLGYERIGTDLRSEFSVPSGQVDYITSGYADTIRDTKSIVYEFKNPEERLNRHEEQLFGYMDDTGAAFGVLTNGIRFELYQRTPTAPEKKLDFRITDAGEEEASILVLLLGYWSIQEQNIKPLAEKTAKEVVESIPESAHIGFSEAGVELFADHLARYLKQEFQKQ